MLDNYKYEQPILYNVLNNSISNNKLSHAYLFDSNGNSDVYDIVLSFTKMIITSNITNETEKNNIQEYQRKRRRLQYISELYSYSCLNNLMNW